MGKYEVEITDVRYFNNPEREINGRKISPQSGMVIDWTATVGWGQLTIIKNENGYYEFDTECMSNAFVEEVLEEYKNFILKKL